MEQQVAKLKKEYFSVNHRKRLLLAGLAAAVVLAILWSLHVVADALSRMLVTAIGVITSMIGVPFFIWLIVQKRQEV